MLPEQARAPEVLSASDIRESERLEALDRLDLIDAPEDEYFDRVARLVRATLDMPVAVVSVLDAHRQLFKSSEGLTQTQVDRNVTFCTHTIQGDKPMIVPDTLLDPRFEENPQVTGERPIRFYAGAPLRTDDGHNIGTICVVDRKPRQFGDREAAMLADMAELVMEHVELRRLVTTDALTGALSRGAFSTAAARALALAIRHKYNLSLVAFDLDHFKSINDGFGHAAGDKVLADVAAACASCLRASDVFGRIGGEEFALVLPHTNRSEAIQVAEKLRGAIAAIPFEPNGARRQVTASFGVSTVDIVTKDVEGLLAKADTALYRAKAEGRNRVVAADNKSEPSEASVRRRVLKAGTIHFNGRMSTVDCTVRSLGDEGAGVDLSSSYGLPDKFNLMIRSDGIDRPCRIVSQNERHVEVSFV